MVLVLHHDSSAVSPLQIGHAPSPPGGACSAIPQFSLPPLDGKDVTHRHDTPSWPATHPQTCPMMPTP